ncbi:FYVE zinc finger-domain-containing protein [Desarmillaria tabescens]|uniref:FYVE zinc finger-domain-containing protein n=1 Tax=Armillaria tabescens TaxID=1929756 RepID=A0AA39KCV0_ARMTA|nr:FYVE zinc finger-domain-containing protein [Desarmillaria tabescens]KAK0458468.1 FYVE zinc finger-domain-containing protein [Desarmillaria tabescens]
MQDPESPPPNVPYQAYRSKRHSRNVSNSRLTPNASPPPSLSRPTSIIGPPAQLNYDSWEKDSVATFALKAQTPSTEPIVVLEPTAPETINGLPSPPDSPNTSEPPEPPKENGAVPLMVEPTTTTHEHHLDHHETPPTAPSSPTASSSGSPSQVSQPLPRANNVRKASTFRYVPRTSRTLKTPSLLGPQHSRTGSATAAVPSNLRHSMPPTDNAYSASRSSPLLSPDSSSRITPSPAPLPLPKDNKPTSDTKLTTITNGTINGSGSTFVPSHASPSLSPSPQAVTPPTRTISLHPSPSVSPAPRPPSSGSVRPTPSRSSTSTPPPATPIIRSDAPYRPGFQPRGVYRPRTDEFLALRKISRDGVEESGMQKRMERTKLERRLEKLIALHFPVGGRSVAGDEKHLRPGGNRRASSLFDLEFGDLKRMSLSDATGLWKGVLSSGGGQHDVRAAEQRITPWEDDAAVSKCPLCRASFHPLTNRKHHCRLCGKIICSLPVRHPQRPVQCSTLFVVDPKSRKIEEVGEGVDYGVKKRRVGSISGPGGAGKRPVEEPEDDSEKFLKGVRICQDCRPILLRQQYQQEMSAVPTFAKLYQVLLELEKELEDCLPQFQELIVSLNQDEHPTKEATAARKRLLDIFAQYDAVAKRIRKLPCTPGSSQDRVQMAVTTRANIFLQKHMFPLQSLPKAKPKHKKSASTVEEAPIIDPDSEVAHALQPLLEQEALLESFVEEANAHRKFEDAKALRISLGEIRAEIERILANAENGAVKGKGKKRS